MGHLRLLFLLFLTYLFFQNIEARNPLVYKICGPSRDYSFCLSIFKDYRNTTANMSNLCLISINKTLDQVTAASDRIPALLSIASRKGAVESERLKTCEISYHIAASNFQRAFESASSKAYQNANNWVRDGTSAATECMTVYQRKPPIQDSPIARETIKVVKLTDVTLLILQSLITGKLS